MFLPALVALALPYPKAWIGSWEGPAVLMGGHKGRIRLDFAKDGKVALSETLREKDGRLSRSVYSGSARRSGRALTFMYYGVTIDADNPKGASVASEAGDWFLSRLRLKKGVLSGAACLNEHGGDGHRFLLRRRTKPSPP